MAEYNIVRNVAVISINNQPANALSHAVKLAIQNLVKKAGNNDDVEGIVLMGKDKNFSAGSDINELNADKYGVGTLIEVIHALEKSPKPVVAAVQGYALGGGLELSLGCHYRIAKVGSTFGLPEVKLGLLSAGAGTQRLPRLIGLENAAEWSCFGNSYSSESAFKVGVVDKLVAEDADLLEAAVQFVKSVQGRDLDDRRISTKLVPDRNECSNILVKYTKLINQRCRGAKAPTMVLQALRNSVMFPYKVGLAKEKEAMQFLMQTSESKAQMYAFFAERKVRKWKIPGGVDHGFVKPLSIGSVAVIGLGTMGRGIVISLLKAGMEVHIIEQNDKLMQAGLTYVQRVLENYRKKNLFGDSKLEEMKKNIKPAASYQDLSEVDLVIEAVFESMKVKKDIFSKLDECCKPDAVLASNTSSLDIDEIASATNRPQQVIGMHFFAPAHLMKLLENIRGAKTSPQTIATAMDMGREMDKVTVLVGNCPGFVGNRMFGKYTAESEFMLEEGAYPHEIDKILKDFGFAMGRFQVGDLSGNDIGYKIREHVGITNKQCPGLSERDRYGTRYCPLSDILVENGRLGLKTGKGWYNYVGQKRALTIDPEVSKIIEDYRRRNNIKPRNIGKQEVLERSLYPLINEGFKILEDGIASDPHSIDMIIINGYAWPRHTGGPMFYAYTVGLPKVLKAVQERWRKSGPSEPHWEPSQLLVNLVEKFGNPDINKWMELAEKGGHINGKL